MATQYIEHPQTKERIPFEWNKDTPPTSADIDSLFQAVSGKPEIVKQPIPKPNYLSRVSGRVGQAIEDASSPDIQRLNPMIRDLTRVGKLAGGVNDIIGDTLGETYKHAKGVAGAVIPKSVQRLIESTNPIPGMKSDPEMQKIGSEFGQLYTGAKDAYGRFSQENPNATALLESALNIGMLAPTGFGAKKGAAALSPKLVPEAEMSLEKSLIDKSTKQVINKAADKTKLLPTRVSKYSDIESFRNSMASAVPKIVENKQSLKFIDKEGNLVAGHLPETMDEFAQVVPQMKAPILQQYKTMAAQAGDAGVQISTKPALEVIEAIEKSPLMSSIQQHYPDAAKKIKELKEYYTKTGQMTPDAMDAEIQVLNHMINTTRDPFIDFAIKGVAKANRQELNNGISSIKGEGFQELKKQWGAFNEIEGRVAQRANAVNKGTYGNRYWDMASLAEGIAGLATLNPHIVLASAGTKAGSEFMRRLKDPDRYIKNMFKDVETQLAKKRRQ